MKKLGALGSLMKPSSSATRKSQDNLLVDDEDSHGSGADSSEKSGGVLSGIFRRSPKLAQNSTPVQDIGSSDITEKKSRADDAPHVPRRPTEEVLRNTMTDRLSANPTSSPHHRKAESSEITEQKPKAPPRVPPRPSKEELRNSVTHRLSVNPSEMQGQDCGEEVIKGGVEEKQMKNREEDEGVENVEAGQRTEDDSDECVKESTAEAEKEKIKKGKKKKNPFMLHVGLKSIMNPKKSDEDGTEGVEDDLSAEGDPHGSTTDLSEKSGGVLSGLFKRSPKPAQNSTHAQDDLSADGDSHGSTTDLSEKSRGVLSGLFKRSTKPAQNSTHAQDAETSEITEEKLGAVEPPRVPPRPSKEELRNSITHRLSVNPTESQGQECGEEVLKEENEEKKSREEDEGMTMDDSDECVKETTAEVENEKIKKGKKKKNPFMLHLGVKSKMSQKKSDEDSTEGVEDDLSADGDSHSSTTDLSEKSRGVLSGLFKRAPKPAQNITHGQDDLSADGDSHGSTTDLSEKSGGMLSGLFKWSTKPAQNSTHAQDSGEEVMKKEYKEEKMKNREEDEGMMKVENVEAGQRTEDDSDECVKESTAEAEKEKIKKGKKKKNPFMLHVGLKSIMNPKKSDEDGTEGVEDTESAEIMEDKLGAVEPPRVPPRPSKEELRNSITHRLSVNPSEMQGQDCGKEVIKEEFEEEQMKNREEDEGVENVEAGQRTEDDSDECVKESTAEVKKKPKKKKGKKKKNPFMPHVVAKGKVSLKPDEDGTEGVEKKSLMEQLDEFSLDKVYREEEEDLFSLMEWWGTVQQWEPMTTDDDMTEKEEAKTFALTAEKVQRGIRVFNQLFSERAETLWQHIIDLNSIADGLDRFNKRTKVAQITGGSTSAVGGVATITGLALAPVTMGASLIVTAVGLGVAAAGGLTSAGAGISNTVQGSLDRKKVERILKDFQSKMADLDKCTRFIKQGIENLRELNAPKMKKLKVYNNDFSGMNDIYEDGAMASKAILINANEISKFTQIAMATGGTAARAVQVAAMATGILTGLFVAMDVYFVAKDSQELKKGAKSEFAKKIREVTEQLHQALVELNIIREELQCSENDAIPSFSNSTPASTCITSSSSTSSNDATISISSSSTSTCTTSLTSSSYTSGISSCSSTSTSISSLSSTSPIPPMYPSLTTYTKAETEPPAWSDKVQSYTA